MARGVPAKVQVSGSRSLQVQLSNVTSRSAFVHTQVRARFSEPVMVELGGLQLLGEIAFVADVPAGWLVVFRVPPSLQELIEAKLSQLAPTQSETPDLWGERTPMFEEPPQSPPPVTIDDLSSSEGAPGSAPRAGPSPAGESLFGPRRGRGG